MSSTAMSKKPDLKAIKLESARLEMAHELMKRVDFAAELLAMKQITVSDALELIHLQTAEEYIKRSEKEKKERNLQLIILTKIEGIDLSLAEDLLNEFGSLEAIAEATPEEFEAVPNIDKNRAESIIKEVSKIMSQIETTSE